MGLSFFDAHVLINEYQECIDTFMNEYAEVSKIEKKKEWIKEFQLSDIIFNSIRPFYEKKGIDKLQAWQHKKRLKIMDIK